MPHPDQMCLHKKHWTKKTDGLQGRFLDEQSSIEKQCKYLDCICLYLIFIYI